MKPESPYRSPMSRHGKNSLSEKETQQKKKSLNIYDFDGLLSTKEQEAIRMQLTRPALPSMANDYSEYEWREMSLCKGQTKKFFQHSCNTRCQTHDDGCMRVKSVRDCHAICAACPVLEHCRTWVLNTDLPCGYAGGMSESERQRASAKLLEVSNG